VDSHLNKIVLYFYTLVSKRTRNIETSSVVSIALETPKDKLWRRKARNWKLFG